MSFREYKSVISTVFDCVANLLGIYSLALPSLMDLEEGQSYSCTTDTDASESLQSSGC